MREYLVLLTEIFINQISWYLVYILRVGGLFWLPFKGSRLMIKEVSKSRVYNLDCIEQVEWWIPSILLLQIINSAIQSKPYVNSGSLYSNILKFYCNFFIKEAIILAYKLLIIKAISHNFYIHPKILDFGQSIKIGSIPNKK